MGLLDRIDLRPSITAPPESIELSERGELLIEWSGGIRSVISPLTLRDKCPCASCVEEGTGRKILDRASIPPDIRPLEVRGVGNYAIQIQWSDGHSTGIYSWETLRRASGLEP